MNTQFWRKGSPSKFTSKLLNHNSREGSPPQGLSEARRGREVLCVLILILDPPRGRPVGGGGVHRNQGYGGLNPHNYIRACVIFMGKIF
jgi:hypothetical protein